MSADAQFGMARTLRPPSDFAAVYDGSAAAIPFPGVLDEQAGQPGYDPNLLAGLPVPLGARVLIWFPFLLDDVDQPSELDRGYVYKVIFRLRNPRDFRNPARDNQRKPFHFPKQAPGVSDTTDLASPQRFILPAAIWNVAFQQTEANFGPANAQIRLYPEGVMPNNAAVGVAVSPADSTQAAVVQQGILDPASFPDLATQPAFLPVLLDAYGDEMLIFARKTQPQSGTPPRNWDFSGGNDGFFRSFFQDSEETGIYVMTGMAP